MIYSGSAVHTPYLEGRIMAIFAIALGIPDKHVFSETKAEHSTENLMYSYRMAVKSGFKKIAVATDPFQSATLKSFAWDYSMPVSFLPVIDDSLKTMNVGDSIRIDPLPAFVNDFIPIQKRTNPFKLFLGTLGLEIKKEE